MHPLADAGRVIAGRYRLQAPIGRGAMGVVWRARDQLLDRDVAVKEVHIAESLSDDERAHAYQRTLREAKTAARLNHPAVVTVYDVAEDEGRPWIVMQLISAQSLDQVLATSGPLSPRRAAEIGRQLLSALTVAHAAGVMHRDVKPSNVLLGRDDRAVLTDFGIATFQDDPKLTQTGMVMGSPGFTAPERIRGEDASPASDLWSLGATLFAAVEGHGPFEQRGGALTTMSAIINEDAPEARAAGALAPVIAALLRREPGDRPDAGRATRMITEVLPLLADRTGGAPGGYAPTTLSASSAPKPAPSPSPSLGSPGAPDYGSAGSPGAPDYGSADQTISREPFGSGRPDAGPFGSGRPDAGPPAPAQPAPGQFDADSSAPTTAAPVLGDPHWSGASPGSPAGYETQEAYGAGSAARPEGPPPDFSSWYDPSPRSGAAPQSSSWSGYPHPSSYGSEGSGDAGGPGPGPGSGPGSALGAGAVPWPGAGSAHAPGRRRRSGRAWKVALVLLALIGAGAGAATVVLLHDDHSVAGRGSTTTSPTTAGPTLPAASLVTAINQRLTGAPATGYRSYSQPATGTENAGFTIDRPSSWAVRRDGAYQTYLTDPAVNANLLIDLTPHTYPNDLLAEARYIEARSISRFPGYRRIDLRALTIRGTAGSFWKFTWTDNGVSQEALDLLFVLNTSSGPQSYALYATAPASMWTGLQSVFDEELRTFDPQPK